MKKNICVLGAFAFQTSYYDGQTNKTRNLLTLLKDRGVDVDYFDTQCLKTSKFFVFKMFWKIIRCKTLYYLPAQKNLTYLFPIFYWLSRLFNTKIHYFVVGGWLVEFLNNKSWHRNKLASIAGIHCETHFMRNALFQVYGFKNVDVFPNFRINNFVPTPHYNKNRLKLVFMARVIKKKGLDLIFKLGDNIAKQALQITIDFYGPQQNEENDVEYFDTNIAKYSFMKYHGPLEPAYINKTLEQYDAMLLPTHFYTEGLPGSVLDAYISGIPVIVTKWKHATEFVDDGKSGIIIPFEDNGIALFEAVMRLYNDKDLLCMMKENAMKKWKEFSAEKAWNLLQNYS